MFLITLALSMAAPQQCRTYDANLPRPLAAWKRAGRGLDTGHAVILAAGRDKALSTSIRIRKSGTFGIALDQRGWIDVLPGRGKPLQAVMQAQGPKCSTIRKIVRYKLRPGIYRVSVTRLAQPRARLMLVAY